MRTPYLVVVLLFLYTNATACDVCGCSIGSQYFGILPQYHRNFVGFSYAHLQSSSAHSSYALATGRDVSDESVHSLDLMARVYLSPRWQLLGILPYHNFQRNGEGTATRTNGLGDASIMANYLLFAQHAGSDRKLRQSLIAGGGIKLPTGTTNLSDADGNQIRANLQPGSGSFDFFTTVSYTLRLNDWGLNTDVQGRLNTTNKQDYHFGNRATGSIRIFYWKNIGKYAIMPSGGMLVDASQADLDGRSTTEASGGLACFATAGLEIYTTHAALGFNWQQPVYQNLGGGKTAVQNKFTINLNYFF